MAAPRPTPTAKSERTRDAVVRALEALIEEGDPSPSAGDIAARAGISVRSVYVHFASVDDLHLAVTERATGRILAMLWPIDPEAPLPQRIGDLVRQRARINEEIGPLRRSAAIHAVRSPALAEARAAARRASADQIHRVFATELAGLERDERARRAAVVDMVVSGEAWDVLRGAGGLDPADAATSVRDTVATLLTAGPTARSART